MAYNVTKTGFRPILVPGGAATPPTSQPVVESGPAPTDATYAPKATAFSTVLSGQKATQAAAMVPGSPAWWEGINTMRRALSPEAIARINQVVAEVEGDVGKKLECLWCLTEVLSQRAEFTGAMTRFHKVPGTS